ncbi:MAG: UxaA family hydrolase [Candidatus Bipolaricaulis sp.]|nr:UxaA family hydrolase [Candidatus Bipolaricaulis sp.]
MAVERAVVMACEDNVVTAICDLPAGEMVRISEEERVELRDPIAFGHKFARTAIPKGTYIVKYGARIGRATSNIRPGEHVHIHNVQDIVDEVRRDAR